MNLKKPRRRARLLFALGFLVFVVGFSSFRGSESNDTAARCVVGVVFASCAVFLANIEIMYSRKARRAAMRAERKAAQQGKIVIEMSRPTRVRSRVWQERGTLVLTNPNTDKVPDEVLDASVEDGFSNTDYDDGFILWEGPQRPPKDAKLTTLNGVQTDYDPLAVFTADSTKANGFAISEPDNASARAVAQTARLKAKYE